MQTQVHGDKQESCGLGDNPGLGRKFGLPVELTLVIFYLCGTNYHTHSEHLMYFKCTK